MRATAAGVESDGAAWDCHSFLTQLDCFMSKGNANWKDNMACEGHRWCGSEIMSSLVAHQTADHLQWRWTLHIDRRRANINRRISRPPAFFSNAWLYRDMQEPCNDLLPPPMIFGCRMSVPLSMTDRSRHTTSGKRSRVNRKWQ